MKAAFTRLAAVFSILLLLVSCAVPAAGGDVPACSGALDLSSGKVLALSDGETKVAPASLTKLLTALTALDLCGKDEPLTVGTELSLLHENSSLSFIREGHVLTLYDLISAMLLVSGNDAAYTVAANLGRRLGGEGLSDEEAVRAFVKKMNKKAKALGMDDSRFTTPDGWDDEGQFTTVRDLLNLGKAAWENETLRSIVGKSEYFCVFVSGESITWKNTNAFLDPDSPYFRDDVKGLKTGTTDKAGKCLLAVFETDGRTVLTCVVGAKTEEERYLGSVRLLEAVPGTA